MMTIHDLLEDKAYRDFLKTKPITPAISRDPAKMTTPPWVVYVQKEQMGPWGKKEFWKYSEAYRFLMKAVKLKVHDAALNNRRIPCKPPSKIVRIKGKFVVNRRGEKQQVTKAIVWAPKLPEGEMDHHWCLYCRRPTIFKYFRRHKALKMPYIDSSTPRCCICGSSARVATVQGERYRVGNDPAAKRPA